MTRDATVSLPVPLAQESTSIAIVRDAIPPLVEAAGPAATFAWDEFALGSLRNPHTRAAYLRAVRRFLAWCGPQTADIARITPGMVGTYLSSIDGGPQLRKLVLAALRHFFDVLVTRHVVVLNPAASVRGERYQPVEGLTPEITTDQARRLLASIDASSLLGKRDKAVVATLIYTAARAGAVGRLRLKHLAHDGTQHVLRFAEKGGKAREIPVRHDLERILLDYLAAGTLAERPRDEPLFRTAGGGGLTDRAMSNVDICRMVKRRLRVAGLPTRLSPHSFRVCTVTDLLSQGIPLEDVAYLAGHSDPRTTRLYDRRQRTVTRNIVERISV